MMFHNIESPHYDKGYSFFSMLSYYSFKISNVTAICCIWYFRCCCTFPFSTFIHYSYRILEHSQILTSI